jgi:hypothetical protein
LLIKLLVHGTIMEPNFNGTLYNEKKIVIYLATQQIHRVGGWVAGVGWWLGGRGGEGEPKI